MSDATFGTYRDNGDGTFSVTVPVVISGNESDARLFLARQAVRYAKPLTVATVSKVYHEHYLPALERLVDEGERSRSTYYNYTATWRNVVAPAWHGRLVDEVVPLEVQRWLDGLTLGRAKKGVVLLSGIMDYAVRYGMVETNPMHERYLMPSKRTVDEADRTTLTLVEIERLCAALHGSPIEPYAILLAMGGCRVGEALGVLPDDVSRLGGVTLARIDKQVANRGVVTDRLKNRWSYRDAMVPGYLGERLYELRGTLGQPTQAELLAAWPKDVPSPRNMRPSYQGWMRYEARVAPWVIEKLMGHVSEGVTGTNYDRPLAEQLAGHVAQGWETTRKVMRMKGVA